MILLDTHILVWAATGDTSRLSPKAHDDIDGAIAGGVAAVSAATFWELEVKRRKPHANLPSLPRIKGLRSGVLKRGLAEIPISGSLWWMPSACQTRRFTKTRPINSSWPRPSNPDANS